MSKTLIVPKLLIGSSIFLFSALIQAQQVTVTVAPKSIQASESGDGFSFKSTDGKEYYVYHNGDHEVKGVEFLSKKKSTVCLTIDTANGDDITSISNGKCKSEKTENDINLLFAQEVKLKEKCRGGLGDDPATSKSCREWTKVSDKIEAKGWCWGREDQAEFEKEWQKCK
jgi:hypothetical protein